MITSRLSDCVWKLDVWLYFETVCILICIWCLLNNLNFLYHSEVWYTSPESWGLSQWNKRYVERARGVMYLTRSHFVRTLQLFVILFTAFWQYADLQLNSDTCTVTSGCSSVRVIYVAFAFIILLYCQYGVYRSKMLLFCRTQNSCSHWLQRLGFLSHLSLLTGAIVIQFYIEPIQGKNGNCGYVKSPKQWSFALYIATGNVIFTEMLNLCLFVYPLHKISSDEKLSKIESITARSITWLIIRSTATAGTTTLGTLIFLVFWGYGVPNFWQKTRQFTLFVILGLVQYSAMSFSYMYWDWIFCPKVLSIRGTRFYACLSGRRRSSIGVLEELTKGLLDEELQEQNNEQQRGLPIHSWTAPDRCAELSIVSLNSERTDESKRPYQASPLPSDDFRNLQIPDRSNARGKVCFSEQKSSMSGILIPIVKSSSSPEPTSHARVINTEPTSHARVINFYRNIELSLGFPRHKKR